MEPNDILHLENILIHCGDIDDAIDELSIDYDSFSNSRIRRGILAFLIEQIGEETKKLSLTFKEAHPEINWKAAAGFRDHISHGYFGINPDVLWDTIHNDVPELRSLCEKSLKKNQSSLSDNRL